MTTGRLSFAAQNVFQGCLISPGGYRQFRNSAEGLYSSSDNLIQRNRHFRTTGDGSLDRDLDRAFGVVADLFGISPAFGFYDPSQFQNAGGMESNVMNAFATPEDTDIRGTHGTVGFGWDLFQREFYQFDNTGMSIMAIAAHALPTARTEYRKRLCGIDQSARPRALEDGQGFFDPVFVWITLIRGLTVRACSEA
jgi:hypothetical protein